MSFTETDCKRNGSATLTMNNAEAEIALDFSDKPGEKVILIVDNTNSTEGHKATITVSKGDYLSNVIGDLVVEVAEGTKCVIGPLETARFKNADGEVDIGVAVVEGATLTNVKIGLVKLP